MSPNTPSLQLQVCNLKTRLLFTWERINLAPNKYFFLGNCTQRFPPSPLLRAKLPRYLRAELLRPDEGAGRDRQGGAGGVRQDHRFTEPSYPLPRVVWMQVGVGRWVSGPGKCLPPPGMTMRESMTQTESQVFGELELMYDTLACATVRVCGRGVGSGHGYRPGSGTANSLR